MQDTHASFGKKIATVLLFLSPLPTSPPLDMRYTSSVHAVAHRVEILPFITRKRDQRHEITAGGATDSYTRRRKVRYTVEGGAAIRDRDTRETHPAPTYILQCIYFTCSTELGADLVSCARSNLMVIKMQNRTTTLL